MEKCVEYWLQKQQWSQISIYKILIHFTCALASFGSMILRWISPALNAYGKHFKWGVNRENTVDEFYSIALDGGGFIW